MAQAVRQIPQSVRLWSKAADLETEMKAKKRVFRKGKDPKFGGNAGAIRLEQTTKTQISLHSCAG